MDYDVEDKSTPKDTGVSTPRYKRIRLSTSGLQRFSVSVIT
jgi:hypothetical protein